MPVYDVYHILDLSMEQRDKLAMGLTAIHSEQFSTPKLFVNVEFHDSIEKNTYVGGKRKSSNRIVATVRHGPSRTQELYRDLCSQITKLWNEVIPDAQENARHELRAIFIVGGLVAGAEAGFALPAAGEDKQWLEKNIEDFKAKADAGDEDFVDMLVDIKHRRGFEGIVGDWKSEGEVKEEKEQQKKKEKEQQE